VDRLTPDQRDRILSLAKQGFSLRRISEVVGLGKSTIYYHTRKVLGRKYIQMVFDYSPTCKLGEFLGIFVTDGCFYVDKKRYHYTLSISLSKNQHRYAKIVQKLVQGIIGKRPRIDIKARILQLVVRGKAILGFLRHFLTWEGRKAHTIHFAESALSLGKDFLRGAQRSCRR